MTRPIRLGSIFKRTLEGAANATAFALVSWIRRRCYAVVCVGLCRAVTSNVDSNVHGSQDLSNFRIIGGYQRGVVFISAVASARTGTDH